MSVTDAFSKALLDLATQTVTLKVKTSINNYGENAYAGASTSYSAYIQRVTGLRSDISDINEYVVEYKAYIPSTTYSPTMDDQVTFPDGKIRDIVEVDIRYDEYGQQAVVLSLGRRRR